MPRAIGLSVHTGWAAAVVVAGSAEKPEIVAKHEVEILGDDERFCFHMAAEMKLDAAKNWLARLRKKATANAARSLAPLIDEDVRACAIVAKTAKLGDLADILAAHPRIHTAEGAFYRDVLCDAVPIRVRVISPSSIDISKLGKISPPPWGKDQKLAALAAWSLLGR